MKPKEYDVVQAVRAVGKSVPKGSTGTVLIVHDSPTVAYVVEFMENGETLDVLTVEPEDIEIVGVSGTEPQGSIRR